MAAVAQDGKALKYASEGIRTGLTAVTAAIKEYNYKNACNWEPKKPGILDGTV
jgi:hypothetical protein